MLVRKRSNDTETNKDVEPVTTPEVISYPGYSRSHIYIWCDPFHLNEYTSIKSHIYTALWRSPQVVEGSDVVSNVLAVPFSV